MNSLAILTFTAILALVAVTAVPISSQLNEGTPTDGEAVEALKTAIHHLMKRQMDMSMFTKMGPDMAKQMADVAKQAMEESGGDPAAAMAAGSEKAMSMAGSAMEMAKGMSG